MAAATRRADLACIFLSGPYILFDLYILFGTKGRARAGVRPCTGQQGGQNLPVSRRDIRSRTRMTPGGRTPMGPSAAGTAAGQAAPAGPPLPGTVRLAGMLTLSCLISQAGQTTVTFAGELDAASADQAYDYVRDAIDAHGGPVLLNMAGLSFCDARGLGALARMSRHAGQAGSCLHLVAPPPRLVKIICITGLQDTLPAHRADQAGHVQVA